MDARIFFSPNFMTSQTSSYIFYQCSKNVLIGSFSLESYFKRSEFFMLKILRMQTLSSAMSNKTPKNLHKNPIISANFFITPTLFQFIFVWHLRLWVFLAY